MSDNKRIAKNTFFLYIRMFITMGVSLYTSRVVLDKLGVDDFGLYNVVGGVVGVLGFLSSTLNTSTSRYITYSFGQNDSNNLIKTFNTAFYTHVALATIVILLLETIGLWFFYNKLIIPVDRLDSAFWVYQFSLITCFISITQTPYSSDIIAHEKMGIYAYISIFEAFAKLVVVYLLVISNFDKLVVYAFLLMVVQILVAMIYRVYCKKNFIESRLRLVFDKKLFFNLLSFSGWNLTANLAEMLNRQGMIILINMFFQPAIVAAQAIGNQISSVIMIFVGNVRTAVNPQVIKMYASGDYEGSKRLTLQSTVFVYDLLLLIYLPIILLMKPILELWLVDVPPYTIIFAQYIVAQGILNNFNSSFYTPLLASGKIKKNAMAAVLANIPFFLLLYFVLKLSHDVMWIPYLTTVLALCWAIIIRPLILFYDVNYSMNELLACYCSCIKVTVLPILVLIPLRFFLINDTIENIIILFISSLFIVSLSSWLFLDKTIKHSVLELIRSKVRKLN